MSQPLYERCVVCFGEGLVDDKTCPVCDGRMLLPHGGTAEQFDRYRSSHEKLKLLQELLEQPYVLSSIPQPHRLEISKVLVDR